MVSRPEIPRRRQGNPRVLPEVTLERNPVGLFEELREMN
jgi:hypothetical protein